MTAGKSFKADCFAPSASDPNLTLIVIVFFLNRPR